MSDFKKAWSDGFSNLAIKIARRYGDKETKESVLSSLKFYSVSDCLLERYRQLVDENEIPKLEELPEDHKMRLWMLSAKYGEGKNERTNICKCIYLLDVLTSE